MTANNSWWCSLADKASNMADRVTGDNSAAGSCEKVHAKLGEERFAWADGLCIGCVGLWAAVRRDNLNMQEFLCSTLHVQYQCGGHNCRNNVMKAPKKEVCLPAISPAEGLSLRGQRESSESAGALSRRASPRVRQKGPSRLCCWIILLSLQFIEYRWRR